MFGGGGEEEVTSTVLAISYQLRDGLRNMGVAYWDVSRVELGVAEFVDNDHFSNLEVGEGHTLYNRYVTCTSNPRPGRGQQVIVVVWFVCL